ncbi:MAG: hypothetical protein R6V14_09095 [Halanaerobiales bacterium]
MYKPRGNNVMVYIRKAINISLIADESRWITQDVIKKSKYEAEDLLNIKIVKPCGLSLVKKIEAVLEYVGLQCIVVG